VLAGTGDPGAYHWRVRLVGERPSWKRSPWFGPTRSSWTEIDFRRRWDVASADVDVAGEMDLAAQPSVFHRTTTLRFAQPEPGPALPRIYDATGREVDRLLDRTLDAGTHAVTWDPQARGVVAPSGVYFARLDVRDDRASIKLVRMR
jgi:hypothetical protein